jgi:hypothetical protein
MCHEIGDRQGQNPKTHTEQGGSVLSVAAAFRSIRIETSLAVFFTSPLLKLHTHTHL